MSRKPVKDVAASIRQRLMNQAKETARPFAELLQRFGIERFLYRFSQSPHNKKFILKGALLLVAWDSPKFRPTIDIDFLGRTKNDIPSIEALIREICSLEVEGDGVSFDSSTVTGREITQDATYKGVRVVFQGQLGNARIPMQIDIGFGDIIVPGEQEIEYPVLLHFPTIYLHSYTKESSIAEKFEAMVTLGEVNSRMKDFFDIWWLSKRCDFQGAILAKAIQVTFANRETVLTVNPVSFSPAFTSSKDKISQWQGFIRKNKLDEVPERFDTVVKEISYFLEPIIQSLVNQQRFQRQWNAPGPWT